MSFLLLSVNHIIAVHDEVLELDELQGMADDKSLEAGLSWATSGSGMAL